MNMKVLEDGRRLWDVEDVERMLFSLKDEVNYHINDIFDYYIMKTLDDDFYIINDEEE